MKFFKNLDNVITLLLVVIIVMLLIAIYRKWNKLQEKKKQDKEAAERKLQDAIKTATLEEKKEEEKKEYYSDLEKFGTAQELSGLDVFSGRSSYSDYRPEQGMFARDPIDIAVRSGISGGSGYATSGSDIFLDPSKFTVYAPSDSHLYGTY